MNKGTVAGAKKKFSVSFLGGFQMEMAGILLTDEVNRSQKLWNVLAYLIVNRERHISQSELIELFWSSDSGANPANALKTLLFRIRGMIESYFGADVTPIISHRGAYGWNPDVVCDVDIDQFSNHCSRAQTQSLDVDKRIALYRKAIALYHGDFLPKLAGQLWVVPISARYHMMYLDAVKALAELLEQREGHEEISDLCIRASELDPLDETIHTLIVRALVRQGRSAAALSHYEKATDLLYRNLGVRPSAELRNLHAEIMKSEQELELDIGVVQQDLKEASFKEGAFFCDYGVFKETYRLEARRCIRNATCVHVALITVTLPNGGVPPLDVLNTTMDQLQGVLRGALRRGDVISKYSGAQHVVLLPSANYEDSVMVIERALNLFHQKHRRNFLKISYKIRELEMG